MTEQEIKSKFADIDLTHEDLCKLHLSNQTAK